MAVLLVVALHYDTPGFSGGMVGVDIFFVLSGYLITSVLRAGRPRFASLGTFYLHRCARLLPALLLVAGSLLALRFLLNNPEQATPDVIAAVLYVANWASAFKHGALEYLGQTWSLAVEEQFYLLWPATLFFLLRYGAKRVALAALILIVAIICRRIQLYADGLSSDRIYNGLDTRLDELLVGCGMALIQVNRSSDGVGAAIYRISRRSWPAAALLLALMVGFAPWSAPWMLIGGYLAAAIAAAVIITACSRAAAGLPGSMLTWRPLVMVGQISYGLYLWHYPAGRYFHDVLALPPTLARWIAFAVSLLLASFSYVLVERPIRRWAARRPVSQSNPLGWVCAGTSVASIVLGLCYFWPK